MPYVTKTVSILASEHLQDVLNTRCGFMSVQYEFEKTLQLIRRPVHPKVTDLLCSCFLKGSSVQSISSNRRRYSSPDILAQLKLWKLMSGFIFMLYVCN